MPGLLDRICSALTYFTFGIFGIIWLVYVFVFNKKLVSRFVIFNIYQSFFVSIFFALIGFGYDFLYKTFSVFGSLAQFMNYFDLFVNRTPIYFGFTLSGLIITIFIGYLVIFSIFGKKPFVPFISRIIEANTGV